MNWKAAAIGVACFGAGLFAGFTVARKPPAVPQPESTSTRTLPGDTPAKPPAKWGTAPASNATDLPKATGAPSTQRPATTVADLETALRASHSRWDFGDLYRVLDGLDPGQYRDTLTRCLKAADSGAKYMAVHGLSARWGRINPPDALAFAQTLSNSSQRTQVISGVLSGWAESDPAAAMAWAKQLPNGQLQNQAIGAVADTLASQDPQAAINFMNTLPAGLPRLNMLYPVFNEWARRSPQAAAAAALQLSGREHDQAISIIASAWATQDPAAALAWASQLPPGTARNQALANVATGWA